MCERAGRVLIITAVLAGIGARAHAQEAPQKFERPRTMYVVVPPDPPDPTVRAANPQHRILFLNRNGGVYVGGPNDSSHNVQSISGGEWTMPPFEKGDALWNEFMTCMRSMWERFDIEVTDVDPGDVQHLECVVSGRPAYLGLPNTVGGISPITNNCTVIEKAVSFAFAELYGSNMQVLCETAAQEVSHSLGLDHEFLCEDPMTYLSTCGNKTFQDKAARCGEYEERDCRCGSRKQNSVQWLLDRLGTSDAIPPSLTILDPPYGSTVPPAFPIQLDVSDNGRLAKVELVVNGVVRERLASPPYTLRAPFDLPLGQASIEVRATDGAVNTTKALLEVNIEAECSAPSDCAQGDCVDGRCGLPLGAECATHVDCASGVCARPPGSYSLFCSTECDADGACPADLTCAAQSNLCWSETGDEGGGGGCEAGGSPTLPGAAAALLVCGLIVVGMRRSKKR